ncbi:MAG: alanine racemase [Saccharofermentanales bacterium]
MQENLLNRSWAEVNLDNIAHNVKTIRNRVKRGVEVMGIVKADAYGHGIREIVPVLLDNGVSRLAVSMLDEAIELRKYGVKVPILVLSYTDPRRADEIIGYNVTQTVYSKELALSLSAEGVLQHKEVRIHIKVDTGMGRVGFMTGFEAIKSIVEIQAMPSIVIEGLYTHFSSADEDEVAYTISQFEQFMSICNELGRLGIQIPIKHVCNSAAALRFPYMHLDMVRIGILLYGMSPSPQCRAEDYGFIPAMSLKTNVIMVKTLEPGHPISYGRTFTTGRLSKIATIPIGYADGFSRILSNRATVLLHEKRFPVVGNICMDTCMIDITDADDDDIRVGDEVVIFGRQGDKYLSADEIADLMGTINYEVTCIIGKRVPRAYIKEGRLAEIKNYLLGN